MTHTTQKAKRAELTIAGITIEAFELPSGEKVLSQRQTAMAVDKHHTSLARWIQLKSVKAMLGEASTLAQIPMNDNPESINIVTPDVAIAYWSYQCQQGNQMAIALITACAQETLQRRLDLAFQTVKSEPEYEDETEANYRFWLEARDYSKACHELFQATCCKYGFNAARVHDRLTLAITGKTAEEHRRLLLIGNDADVGLDYVECSSELRRIGKAKVRFSRGSQGTLTERLQRAVRTLQD